MIRRLFLPTSLLFALLLPAAPVRAGAFAEPWHGAAAGPEAAYQLQRLDPDTVILRQSIATNFEGPFLFLFFGRDRALLVDSGAGGTPLKPWIDAELSRWRQAHGGRDLPLVIAHSHSHGDHIQGDAEFAGVPGVTVVGHSPEAVAAFFHLDHWPEGTASIDLGDRVIDVIPMPGHEAAELGYYDRRSGLLLTGDALYPGRLYCTAGNFDAFRRSIDRVAAFTQGKKVTWILGNHIEMTETPRRDYAMHATAHPAEHALELPYARLLELQSALQQMGDRPRLDLHDDFIFYPVP